MMDVKKWIWLDMDGTIADLYSVSGWLKDLRSFNARPFVVAKPMYNMDTFKMVCFRLQEIGYHIGVVSWLSKEPEQVFDNAVTAAKREWLARYGMDEVLDEIIIAPHGTRKADLCRGYGVGILVDDEKKNRDDWDLGATINAKENVLAALLGLLR